MKKYDVCVIGLGPVGATTAACFAKQGKRVIGIDNDRSRLMALRNGQADFLESGLDALLLAGLENGFLTLSEDLAAAVPNASVVMIAIGTPATEEHGLDLSLLGDCFHQLGEVLHNSPSLGIILCVRSTMPPGTLRHYLAPLLGNLRLGEDFHLAVNPEFLRRGHAIGDFFEAPRIVIGSDDSEVAETIEKLYSGVRSPCIRTTIETAEFSKYVDNAWHALKVTFANEIARTVMGFGGSVEDTSAIFLADHKLNISENYLKPGFVFGGSCLPKDVKGLCYLSQQLGVNTPVLNAILPSNDAHLLEAVEMIHQTGARIVGLLGITFKPSISTISDSPALRLAQKLAARGVTVLVHDVLCQTAQLSNIPHAPTFSTIENIQAHAQCLILFHRSPLYENLLQQDNLPIIDLTKTIHLPSNLQS